MFAQIESQEELNDMINYYNNSNLSKFFKIKPFELSDEMLVLIAKDNDTLKGSVCADSSGAFIIVKNLWAVHPVYAVNLLKLIELLCEPTYYIFSVLKNDIKWNRTVEKFAVRYDEDNELFWYARKVDKK